MRILTIIIIVTIVLSAITYAGGGIVVTQGNCCSGGGAADGVGIYNARALNMLSNDDDSTIVDGGTASTDR
jgi:flagellar basal body-associated protein FliL